MAGNPFTTQEEQRLHEAIKSKYRQVADSASGLFKYKTGREGAETLGYDPLLLEMLPPAVLDSFCGVGNPFTLVAIVEGRRVLDIGCGAGLDLCVASSLAGSSGQVYGVDLTEEMVEKAKTMTQGYGKAPIRVEHVFSETLPFADRFFDHVISNGVFNLSPAKLELFKEIRRVLKPGGWLHFADIVLIQEQEEGTELTPEGWSQ